MPPLYVFSSHAKDPENFQIDPAVCEGLPLVRGKYAGDVSFTEYPSFVAVRHTGSVDTSLWHDLNKIVYIPCFGDKISPEPVRDPLTNKLISGPLIVKTDAGPGRLSKEADSMDFRDEMAALGVHIVLSLPNGTAATAEMDQLYSKFKPRCSESTIRVAGIKMAKRVVARKKQEETRKRNENRSAAIDDSLDQESEAESSDDDNDHEDTSTTRKKKRARLSACHVSLGNRDLGNIVNGVPDDDISKRPFDRTFTKTNIINSWIAVGFLPMTGNAVNDPKVRFELGEGGAPEAEQKRMRDLYSDYCATREELAGMEFNVDLLDLEPPQVTDLPIPENEEAAIQALLENGGVNKAGSLFRVGVCVANSRVVLETLRRTKELAEKVRNEKEEARKVADDGKLKSALEAFGKWCGDGNKVDGDNHPIMSRTCALAIVKVLMPKVAPLLKLSNFTTLKSCTKWLGELAGGTTWADEMKAMIEIEEDDEQEELNPRLLFDS
jgi:hypothetical protein